MPVTATIYPCHGEHFHGITARIALEEGKLRKIRKVKPIIFGSLVSPVKSISPVFPRYKARFRHVYRTLHS